MAVFHREFNEMNYASKQSDPDRRGLHVGSLHTKDFLRSGMFLYHSSLSEWEFI